MITVEQSPAAGRCVSPIHSNCSIDATASAMILISLISLNSRTISRYDFGRTLLRNDAHLLSENSRLKTEEAGERHFFPVKNYNLAATLTSGQAFRWYPTPDGAWQGVIGRDHLTLRQHQSGIESHSLTPNPNWPAIQHYLQTQIDIDTITATFPNDPPTQAAIAACPGLRLLRQDPWECLASFILSSTKQIVQIQQIVAALCSCYGDDLKIPDPQSTIHNSFPSAAKLASLTESQLRSCKMGFRAPYLLQTARIISSNQLNLESLRSLLTPQARETLCELPGVGEKIANCVLLFAYGFQDAFPVDVWVQKAIRQLYFPKRKPTAKRLKTFVQTHFGPNAGYAQQYLFHYIRTQKNGHD